MENNKTTFLGALSSWIITPCASIRTLTDSFALRLLLLDEQREHLRLGEHLQEAPRAPRTDDVQEAVPVKLERAVKMLAEMVAVVSARLHKEVDERLRDHGVSGIGIC